MGAGQSGQTRRDAVQDIGVGPGRVVESGSVDEADDAGLVVLCCVVGYIYCACLEVSEGVGGDGGCAGERRLD